MKLSKRHGLSLFVVFTFILALSSLGTHQANAQIIFGPGEPSRRIKLRLHLKKGQVIERNLSLDETVTQNPNNQNVTSSYSHTYGMRYTVLGVTAKGNYRIQTTFKSVKYAADSSYGTISYDSATTKTVSPMAAHMAALAGQSFIHTVAPNGKTVSIEGTERIISRFLTLSQIGSGDRAQARRWMKAYVENDMMFGRDSLPLFPSRAIGEEDTWLMKNKGDLPYSQKYTVAARENGLMELDFSSTYTLDSRSSTFDYYGVKVKYAVKGADEGLLTINEKTGWLEDAERTTTLSGTILSNYGKDRKSWSIRGETTYKIWRPD